MLNCYYMDISCECSHEQMEILCKLLPEERLKKTDRLRNKDMAKKYLLSSAFLQYGLSDALGIPMKAITYVYGEYGKPGIVYKGKDMRGRIDFNLSHSGKYAVLAVSDRPVGIDVERLKSDRAAVAQRFFCKEEYEDILETEGLERDGRFLQYWTMKEAYVKRTGNGLNTPLNSFLISRKENELSVVAGEHIYFSTFFLEAQMYCVSVCSEGREELEKLSRDTMHQIGLKQIVSK